MKKALICSLISVLIGVGSATPFGAPREACTTMSPNHHGTAPQTKASPFLAMPFKNQTEAGMPLPVTLATLTNDAFRGFLVMAFDASNDGSAGPIGAFHATSLDAQPLGCFNGSMNAATHVLNNDKLLVVVNWVAPTDFTGVVVFKTTFVQNFSVYWIETVSGPVQVVPCREFCAIGAANQSGAWTGLILFMTSLVALI